MKGDTDMNNETMLKRLLDIQIGDGSTMDYSKFRQLIEDLEADIRTDNNKASGNGNLAKLAKAIFKTAPKFQKLMQYSHIEDGIQFILDGYRIAGFYEHIDIPDFDACKEHDNLPPKWFDVSKIINSIEYDDERPLQLPTIGQLKADIKIAKAGKPRGVSVMWRFENGPCVNAQFLLEFMEAYPDIKIYASVNKPMVSPLYVSAEKGMGILLPIHMKHELDAGIHTNFDN